MLTPLQEALVSLAAQDTVRLVQVGACTGLESNDPLRVFLEARGGFQTTAILIEPVRHLFDQLCAACPPGGICLNVALARTSGQQAFYYLAADPRDYDMPKWLEQLGSLRDDRLTTLWESYEAVPALQAFYLKHRVCETVTCLSLDDLLTHYRLDQLDLLQIDAEGSDYDVLCGLDLARVRPRFINYERVLLGADAQPCRTMLQEAGYTLTDHGQDTFCALKQTLPARSA